MVGFGADAVFRASFLIFSIGQLILLGSDGMGNCTLRMPALQYDANWLRSMATVQLLFIPSFYLWRYFAVLDEKSDARRDGQAPAGPDGERGMNQEEQALLEKLKREAKEVSQLRQECLEARNRLSQKERQLEQVEQSAIKSMNDLNPNSTDRTDTLMNKRDRLRDLEGDVERKIQRRRRRRQAQQQQQEQKPDVSKDRSRDVDETPGAVN